jgi:hypothetical protein
VFVKVVLMCGSIQNVANIHGLVAAAWFAPMAGGGLILALVSGFTLHRISGKMALLISGLRYLLCVVLLTVIPADNASYWGYVFPEMLGATLGVDVTYGVANIFITTSLPKNRQALAGALINSEIFLGISFFLGLADMIERYEPSLAYRGAFYLGVGLAVASLGIIVVFIRMGRAKGDLTADERAQRIAVSFTTT